MSVLLLLAAAGVLYFISTGKLNLGNIATQFRTGSAEKATALQDVAIVRTNSAAIKQDIIQAEFLKTGRLLG